MADIQNLLQQLLNAVYGKDVRQAIYDSIQQCYYDGKAGSIDLTARQQIDDLAADVLEMQETGATAEVIEAKVQTVINELIADGTMSGMTLADGSVTIEKLSDEVITSLQIQATYDETTGDLTFNAIESLVSAYPVGFENANANVGYTRNSETGELEASTDKSASNWFALPDGVYKTNNVKVGVYYTLPTIYEADKATGQFIRCLNNLTVVNVSGTNNPNRYSVFVAKPDKVYSFVFPTEGYDSLAVSKNEENDIPEISVALNDIFDKLEFSTNIVSLDLTEYGITTDNVYSISKFNVDTEDYIPVKNKFGTYAGLNSNNYMLSPNWDSVGVKVITWNTSDNIVKFKLSMTNTFTEEQTIEFIRKNNFVLELS